MTSFNDLRLIAQIDNQCKELGFLPFPCQNDELRCYVTTFDKQNLIEHKYINNFAYVQVVIACTYVDIIINTALSSEFIRRKPHEIEYFIKKDGCYNLKMEILKKIQNME